MPVFVFSMYDTVFGKSCSLSLSPPVPQTLLIFSLFLQLHLSKSESLAAPHIVRAWMEGPPLIFACNFARSKGWLAMLLLSGVLWGPPMKKWLWRIAPWSSEAAYGCLAVVRLPALVFALHSQTLSSRHAGQQCCCETAQNALAKPFGGSPKQTPRGKIAEGFSKLTSVPSVKTKWQPSPSWEIMLYKSPQIPTPL